MTNRMKTVSARGVSRPRLPQLSTLNLTFLPYVGAVLKQPIEASTMSVLLITPFGAYCAGLAPQDAPQARTILTLTRLNP